MVKFRKIYNEARYEQLLNSLKQPNAYTHAALYPKNRPPKSTGRNARLITLPEGHLLLARRSHRHAPELKDLRHSTLELDFFILTYDHARQRVRLQISKKMIRQKLAYVNEICSSQYWQRHQDGSGPEKTVQQVIGTINAVTRELWSIDRHAFVYPDTRRSWDKRVRKSVIVWLISTAKFRKKRRHRPRQTLPQHLVRLEKPPPTLETQPPQPARPQAARHTRQQPTALNSPQRKRANMNDDDHNQGLFSNWPLSLPPGPQEQPQSEPVRSTMPPAARKKPDSTAETSEDSEGHEPAATPVGAAERTVPHLDGEKKLPGKRNRAGYGQYTAYLRTSTRKNVQITLLTRTGEERDFSELVEDLLIAWLKSSSSNPNV